MKALALSFLLIPSIASADSWEALAKSLTEQNQAAFKQSPPPMLGQFQQQQREDTLIRQQMIYQGLQNLETQRMYQNGSIYGNQPQVIIVQPQTNPYDSILNNLKKR